MSSFLLILFIGPENGGCWNSGSRTSLTSIKINTGPLQNDEFLKFPMFFRFFHVPILDTYFNHEQAQLFVWIESLLPYSCHSDPNNNDTWIWSPPFFNPIFVSSQTARSHLYMNLSLCHSSFKNQHDFRKKKLIK